MPLVGTWLGDEVLKLGGARILANKRSLIPDPKFFHFQFDNGLLLEVSNSGSGEVAANFSLMGTADGTIFSGPLDQALSLNGRSRGYNKVLVAQSRHTGDVLPQEIASRLAQVAEGLSRPWWKVWLYQCTDPSLLRDGFPAWRVTSAYIVFLPSPLLRGPDYPGYAARILKQVDPMRRLLEDVRAASPAGKLEPG